MRLHFAYAGRPDNDLRYAPYTITRHLYRFFQDKGLDVRYYDYTDKGPVDVGPDDVVLGHPSAEPGTIVRRWFDDSVRCRAKCTIHPLHHAIPEINLPFDPLARKADAIFSITGPYWYDTLEQSAFAHWKPKIVRVDMAVDPADFPLLKKKFNPPGKRGLLYIGRESVEKGPHVLLETVRRLPANPFLYLGWMQPESAFRSLPNLVGGQPVDLTPENSAQVVAAADIFINTSVSDANPTTLLEAAAWGLIPCCTRQSGYYGDERSDDLFTELFLDDIVENVRRINALNWAEESVLLERARRGRKVIEKKYNWERFCQTVWNGLRRFVEPEAAIKVTTKAKRDEPAPKPVPSTEKGEDDRQPTVVIDGVFFQIINTGIARLWRSLLEQWSRDGTGRHVVVIDRAGTAPKFPGVRYRLAPLFDMTAVPADRRMVQLVCDQEKAALFASTYYTLPWTTPSFFTAYDMIPEVMGQDLREPWWQLKHEAIQHASGFASISKNTAADLLRLFPTIPPERVSVAYPGVDPVFRPRDGGEIAAFKARYGISRPYFLLVGVRSGYKGAGVFFEALNRLPDSAKYEVVCLGGPPGLEPEFAPYAQRNRVQVLHVGDDEMAAVYGGAVALAYPSGYEGFGLPVLEAMACGCPVITCPTGAIPEVAGDATIMVPYGDVAALAGALGDVQQSETRQRLVKAGLERAKQFSWQSMGAAVWAAMNQAIARAAQDAQDDRKLVDDLFKSTGMDPGRTVVLFGGAPTPNRRYEGYGVALAPVCAERGLSVIAAGAEVDKAFSQQDLQKSGTPAGLNACGRLTEKQLIEVMRRCRLSVGGEWGAAHLATAVGLPSVVLVGGGEFGRHLPSSPLTTTAILPLDCYGNGWNCRYPRECCIKDVEPAVLTAAIRDALDRPRDQAPAKPRVFVQDRSLWDILPSQPQPAGLRPRWAWFHHLIDRNAVDLFSVGRRGAMPGRPLSPTGAAGWALIELPWRYRQGPPTPGSPEDQVAEQRRAAVAAVLQSGLGDLPRRLGEVGPLLRTPSVREAPARGDEMILLDEILTGLVRGPGDPSGMQYRVAQMFYFRAHELPSPPEPHLVPDWMLEDYVRWTLEPPELFYEIGEAQRYGDFMSAWIQRLAQFVTAGDADPLAKRYQAIAGLIAQWINAIPLYFHAGDLTGPMKSRAAILREALRAGGFQLDHEFPPRSGRKKVRLGVIQSQFAAQTETYASIPLFRDLSRGKFEVLWYTLAENGSAAEAQCKALADRFVVLPPDIKAQAEAIRKDDLDVLFFGTNLTAVTHGLVPLAAHRLARVQATALHSPVTTGMETMDAFLVGLAGRGRADAQAAYVEKLLVLEEPGMAFDFTSRPPPSDYRPDRATLGIPAGAPVLVSGANFYKIIPEVRRAWARILAAAPDARLIVYPFGPAWSSSYAATPFLRSFYTVLREHGVDPLRLVVMQPLPSPTDIPKLLAMADVYIDSFPYAGAVSMIDALEAGLPAVAMGGAPQRFAQAAALLRSIGLDELVAADEESYVRLASELAKDPERRRTLSQRVKDGMTDGPKFLDTKWYAQQAGDALKGLVRG